METTDLSGIQKLEEKHPRWRVWKSEGGTWWAAFAQGKWPIARERHGCWAHLHAGTPEDLAAKLKKADACQECWGADVVVAA